MPSTANTSSKTKTKTKPIKPTKLHGDRAPKLASSKSVAAAAAASAAKASTMTSIAPPNASMMTAATTVLPVMMPPPSSESNMKMLEELYASVCGQGQCSSFILGEKRDRVIDIVRNVVTIHSS